MGGYYVCKAQVSEEKHMTCNRDLRMGAGKKDGDNKNGTKILSF